MKFLLALSILLFAVQFSFSCTEGEGLVEENDLYISATDKSGKTGGISQERFDSVIEKLTELYEPIVAQAGGQLVVRANWTDGTVNAYAQRIGSSWIVQMFGGLARHSTITEDGFALVMCHELGHHLGGTPIKRGSFWASNEGQSDYFATLKCLRKYFENDEQHDEIVSKLEAPEEVVQTCHQQWSSELDRGICIRGSMAGFSVARLFQALRRQTREPAFTSPDPTVVTRIDDNHPATQCRLDTYYQGALCTVDHTIDVSNEDEVQGTCHQVNHFDMGLRPLCWFKPTIDSNEPDNPELAKL